MEYCVHGVRVSLVYPQDITKSSVAQAVVVPTNQFLCGSNNKDYWLFKSRKNVETRVHEECGHSLQQELDSLPFLHEGSKDKAAIGSVVKTSAYGNLQHMKSLYHVVVPRTYSTVNTLHISQLYQSFLNCISMAFQEDGVNHLGMPALGCGIGAIEPRISCEAFTAACEIISKNDKSDCECRFIEVSFIENKPFVIWQKYLSSFTMSTVSIA